MDHLHQNSSYIAPFLISVSVVILSIRLTACLPQYRQGSRKRRHETSETLRTVVIWGSGGHTTEMIQLLTNLNFKKYAPMYFITCHSDITSKNKILSANLSIEKNAIWSKIYRSREVKQSWMSTIFTTVYSLIQSFILIVRIKPHLIICNGPGTCVPICYSAFLLRLLGISQTTIIFIESFCRVKSLSLSGRLMYVIADKFIVQWPELTERYQRAECLGRIC